MQVRGIPASELIVAELLWPFCIYMNWSVNSKHVVY